MAKTRTEKVSLDRNGDRKTVFCFPDEDRRIFEDAPVGSEREIVLLDEQKNAAPLVFRVTRNARLGSQRRIYGKVLNAADPGYYQAEFKLHDGHPKDDTAEVFPQAPPLFDKD